MVDLHTRAILIQLPQANDGVPQGGDVVGTSEEVMLTGLGLEDDRANPLISTAEASPNLTESCTLESKSEKYSHRPVMWCVAPVSRYQPSIFSSLNPLPRKTQVRGSSRWSRATVEGAGGERLNFSPPPLFLAVARHTRALRTGLAHPTLLAQHDEPSRRASPAGSPWPNGRSCCS
jgi:hypothetical protein